MDYETTAPLLLQMVLGAAQGRLLGRAFALRKKLCSLLTGFSRPTHGGSPPQPPTASKTASWALTALLVPLPGLAWYFWLLDPQQSVPVFALFFIPFFLATAFQELNRNKGDDLIHGTCQTASRLPVLVLFGVFNRKHQQTDAFVKILKDRQIKSLWRKFERIPLDFEEDAALAEKYGVDPEKGVQLVLFGKNAERVRVAGKDCLASAELMQTSTFAEWLRRIDADFGSTA